MKVKISKAEMFVNADCVSAHKLAVDRNQKLQSKKKRMNIEHRTFNAQHRIMYSVYFKKAEQSDSILDIRCWMFDVQSVKGSNYMSALSRAFLLFVGWVEPTPCFVGFRCTQPNLNLTSDILKGETQQRLILGAIPEVPFSI